MNAINRLMGHEGLLSIVGLELENQCHFAKSLVRIYCHAFRILESPAIFGTLDMTMS